jgi:hypothetical protein
MIIKLLIGSGRTIEWCKTQTITNLVATYRCLNIYNAESEMASFRSAIYAQAEPKDREEYQKELVKIREGN